ncbi:hypothetical protein CFN78_27450 [Amycolatopsis antarctica]|uniref:Uncharacterized protein n=1 Tax=Amycolatopsis antarctica TaxID=1854586 RepID=A0A263CY32_9PSEU|nr:hypothetical protein [Amycolatopsis antarctica]OZM70005.1 hypothetical protein CFN78_27450 [Amycolatopsis antarctica]
MGLFSRVRDLLGTRSEPPLTADDPDLAVVAASFDPAEADSAALARAREWCEERPAVLRHHLTLPPDRFGEAATILAQDGWELREIPWPDPDSAEPGQVRVHALRVQVLDALHCAQERSRMAGLAQRLGGDSLGWDALQPVPPQA